MSDIKCFIFDMDGTLIDTEKIYRVMWPKATKEFGYEMSDEQCLQLRSLGAPYGRLKLEEFFGPDFPYLEVRTYRRKLVADYLEEHPIELKPGCVEILHFLKEKGIGRAICTSSDMERTTKYLKRLGLGDLFDHVISTAMVEKGKPAPDAYLYAVEQMGLPKEACVAVEDSPNGVQSAYAAGLRVIMVPDQSEPDEELKKLLFARVDSLLDLKKFV
ncbi:MAG: HAD family phosphatase [Lachnospiraceae bacterium]|nr:HAD family phosphatase [Lachnospiraceae bacterium]